ncbi:hypothetical protein BHYA_0084g00260 [Botrytis hyacinthi]|uniref:Uncharacterized protein n=1 Tax=Botrytis hyacinthi TaxID=278943 RepID=A0A4Z1GMS1_9HELO|nr:hypothetical protein BHYA_0084g00260 [Botrytis hyacinthi]
MGYGLWIVNYLGSDGEGGGRGRKRWGYLFLLGGEYAVTLTSQCGVRMTIGEQEEKEGARDTINKLN